MGTEQHGCSFLCEMKSINLETTLPPIAVSPEAHVCEVSHSPARLGAQAANSQLASKGPQACALPPGVPKCLSMVMGMAFGAFGVFPQILLPPLPSKWQQEQEASFTTSRGC